MEFIVFKDHDEAFAYQTMFIRSHGFEIGEVVRVDNILNGKVCESMPAYEQVCIEFARDDYLAVFPEKADSLYGKSHVMQLCPVDKIVKVTP